jgi:hypothetical protein
MPFFLRLALLDSSLVPNLVIWTVLISLLPEHNDIHP